MAEPEAGDGLLGSPRPALPLKVAESLDDAMLEKTLRPVLVEKKEQLVLLEERGMMLLSRESRSRRFDPFKGTFSARGYRLGRLAVHVIAP